MVGLSGFCLKKKLGVALKLAKPLEWIFSNSSACPQDSKRLIDILGQESITETTAEWSINNAVGASGQKQQLASQHPVPVHIYNGREEEEEEEAETVERPTGCAEDGETRYIFSSLDSSQSNRGMELEQQPEFGQEFSARILWNYFNMQLNRYYSPELGFSFV